VDLIVDLFALPFRLAEWVMGSWPTWLQVLVAAVGLGLMVGHFLSWLWWRRWLHARPDVAEIIDLRTRRRP